MGRERAACSRPSHERKGKQKGMKSISQTELAKLINFSELVTRQKKLQANLMDEMLRPLRQGKRGEKGRNRFAKQAASFLCTHEIQFSFFESVKRSLGQKFTNSFWCFSGFQFLHCYRTLKERPSTFLFCRQALCTSSIFFGKTSAQ